MEGSIFSSTGNKRGTPWSAGGSGAVIGTEGGGDSRQEWDTLLCAREVSRGRQSKDIGLAAVTTHSALFGAWAFLAQASIFFFYYFFQAFLAPVCCLESCERGARGSWGQMPAMGWFVAVRSVAPRALPVFPLLVAGANN